MRRIATLAVIVSLALTTLGALRPTAALAAAPVTFNGAVTDNYKAIWNADPEIRENRTWFAFESVTVNGVVFKPTNLPVAEPRVYTVEEAVTGSDGSTAVVRVAAGPDVKNKPFRTESVGTWGPLLVLTDTSTLANSPVRITITVERNGAVLGSTVVEYRYEDAIYNAPRDSREYNSPGGRFSVGCNPTRLDWQDSAPAADCLDHGDDVDLDPTCTIVGTAGNDVLTGTAGRDVICGLGGNDKLIGGGGDDVLLGGDGNDVLQGGAGDDTIDGGAGVDRITYADAASGIVVNMGQLPNPVWDGPSAGDAGIGFDHVTNVEAVTASRFADQLLGGNGNDILNGGGGADVMYGYAGNDRLYGGGGNDRLYGGSGTDILNGQARTDTCAGGGQATDKLIKCER